MAKKTDKEVKDKFLGLLADTAPAIIIDHAFEPRHEWWSLCEHCGLAMAAHQETTIDPADYIGRPKVIIEYYSDDNPDD
jgi:hypothetical protein